MPGRFFLTRPIEEIAAYLGVDAALVLGEPPRRNIAPGQEVVALDQGVLKRLRWGMVPVARVNARGRPVMETIVNARGETVFSKSAFDGVRRCVVPVDGWYEWTGEKRKKTAWAISAKDGAPLLFAGIADTWIGPGGITVDQLATVTCEPSSDVRDIHHRMGVLLRPDQVARWIEGDLSDAGELIAPWPDGQLIVEPAGNIDWDAP